LWAAGRQWLSATLDQRWTEFGHARHLGKCNSARQTLGRRRVQKLHDNTHASASRGFMEASDYNNALNYDLAVIQLAEDVGERSVNADHGLAV
jgi:hypothetical protein